MGFLISILSFIAGFIFSRFLYYIAAVSTAAKIVKMGNLVILYVFMKCYERIVYYNNLALNDYIKTGASEMNIAKYTENMEEEIRIFKKRSISILLSSHPQVFRNILDYEDWPTAMVFMNSHKDIILRNLNEGE
tara:strand:+ start:7734 stop:8135 length:402 start_codon:yes stop_codon:yes gene_type:complete